MLKKTYNILISDENGDEEVKALCGIFNYYGEVKSIRYQNCGEDKAILFEMKAKKRRFNRMLKVMSKRGHSIVPLVENYYFM